MRGLSARRSSIWLSASCLTGSLAPARAWASFFAGEALDTMADIVALILLLNIFAPPQIKEN